MVFWYSFVFNEFRWYWRILHGIGWYFTFINLKFTQFTIITQITQAASGTSLKMLWMNYCPANDPAVLLKPGLLSAVKKVVPYVNVDCDDSSGESTPYESDDFDDDDDDD